MIEKKPCKLYNQVELPLNSGKAELNKI